MTELSLRVDLDPWESERVTRIKDLFEKQLEFRGDALEDLGILFPKGIVGLLKNAGFSEAFDGDLKGSRLVRDRIFDLELELVADERNDR